MQLFPLLHLLSTEIQPRKTKVHLATTNGSENPLDVFLAGRFEEWQRWQTVRNFKRSYVISLIAMAQKDKWLFAGVHRSATPEFKEKQKCFYYPLTEIDAYSPLKGRLIVHFEKRFRQSYTMAEKWELAMLMSQIREKPLAIHTFPGYRKVDLSREELLLIFQQVIPSWQSALSSVAGVYLITDTETGKLYVGSASGQGGIWQRWSDYANNGHGHNKVLKALLKDEGSSRAKAFRYSILEIADIHDHENLVLQRESHWKNILLTRMCGHNRN
jgi:hypothetical protein